jgi:hypothetical protein
MTARESPEATTGERPVYRLFVKTRVARRWRSRAVGAAQARASTARAALRLDRRGAAVSAHAMTLSLADIDHLTTGHFGEGKVVRLRSAARNGERSETSERRCCATGVSNKASRPTIARAGARAAMPATTPRPARFGTARRCPQGRRSSRAEGRTPAPWQGALALAPPQAEAENEAEARRHERRDPLPPGRCGDDPAARHAGRVGHLTLMEAARGSRTSRVRLINKVPEIHYEH